MDRTGLIAALVAADAAARATLLHDHAALLDAATAWALKAVYDEARGNDPARAGAAADALRAIDGAVINPTVAALAAWTAGRAALQLHGRPADALPLLDQAIAAWRDEPRLAATVEVTRLHALALLGRYDEAIAGGLRARDTLLLLGDLVVAGTIEQNIGNIYHRRDQYADAEHFLRQARERYLAASDTSHLAQAENGIAIELMFQHRFGEAARFYALAYEHAQEAGASTTEAEIEVNQGNLAFLQGRYGEALDFLERARRRYAGLGMPHEHATVELELADAYLELNLVPEAAALYDRVIPTFNALGMQAEQAHALAYAGWTQALLDEADDAYALLWEARALYEAEGNAVGAALTALFEGLILHAHGEDDAALVLVREAIPPLAAARAWSRLLLARWLEGDIERTRGNLDHAATLLQGTLADAERHVVPQVVYRSHTSLGLLAAARGDAASAEATFERAANLVEDLRAPLPAEEFQTAFIADKLLPYAQLVRMALRRDHLVAALVNVERARSRALVDMLGGALPARARPRDAFEADAMQRLTALREELNWFYSHLNDPDTYSDDAGALQQAEDAIRERERESQEIMRQLGQRGGMHAGTRTTVSADDVAALQRMLPDDTVVVEYFSVDGALSAFAIDRDGITVHAALGEDVAIDGLVEQLRFQTDTLRNGIDPIRPHLDLLERRTVHYLQALYDVLLRPLETRIGARRLVVVPHRTLHYVPFHALHDGAQYVVERREVCCVPSAAVLRWCLDRPPSRWGRALLMGVADERTPRVRDEIAALEPLFDHATTLIDEHASRAALREHARDIDVIHLACHGQFRPDNPLFSSLQLGDGWLTVYDAYALESSCGFVTLSACETGVSAIAPGDELIGLARGFFGVGAPTLLVSLWTADDASTATLMQHFYQQVRAGQRPGAALRSAQRALLAQTSHPFFWSPFVLLGRW